jgi:hypothetical protein
MPVFFWFLGEMVDQLRLRRLESVKTRFSRKLGRHRFEFGLFRSGATSAFVVAGAGANRSNVGTLRAWMLRLLRWHPFERRPSPHGIWMLLV